MARQRKIYVYDKDKGRMVRLTTKLRRKVCKVNATGWPMTSLSMAINPERVPEEQARLKKMGVNVDYTDDGRPILTSARHKAAFQRAIGHADPDAGYTGAVPQNFTYDDYRAAMPHR